AASKLLLGVGLVTYGYVLRAQIFGGGDNSAARAAAAAPASGGKELTAGDLNPGIVLKLGRDPFDAPEAPTTKPTTKPTTLSITGASAPPATAPSTQAATRPATMPVVKVPVKLEAIVFGPTERAAIITGQSVKISETVRIQ